MKPPRLILMITCIAVLLVAAIGVWQWNKPHPKVEAQQGIAITADSIAALYNADETKANARFLNKAIALHGTIRELSQNADGQPTVLLATADSTSGVFCTMRGKDPITGLKPGDLIQLKGFCSGKTLDVDLTDCVIDKP